jgi:hypothetical protein
VRQAVDVQPGILAVPEGPATLRIASVGKSVVNEGEIEIIPRARSMKSSWSSGSGTKLGSLTAAVQ